MAVGVVVTLGCMAGGWFLINQGGPKKRRFKGDAVFLVGPCDSGKSAAMLQLRDGDSGEKLRPTHTSQTFNEDFVDGVRVIDFPGHARLRPQLFDMIEAGDVHQVSQRFASEETWPRWRVDIRQFLTKSEMFFFQKFQFLSFVFEK